jgi:hypothetical protein
MNTTSDTANVRPTSVAFTNCYEATTFGRTVYMTAHQERRLSDLLAALQDWGFVLRASFDPSLPSFGFGDAVDHIRASVGATVVAVRERLHARAALLGHASTDDAGLRVVVAGRVLPAEVDGHSWRVRLPPAGGAMRLVSRRWVPAQMRPGDDDHRVLGVALAKIRLDGRMVALDDPRLSSGWHDCERGDEKDTAPN